MFKCAHAFQCEGLQIESHSTQTFFATLHEKKLDIGRFVSNMEIDMMSRYIEEVHAIK
jgi:hypothetical protein